MVNNWSIQLTKWHQPIDNTVFRVLSIVLGFYHVAMVMWDPEVYAASIGGFNALVAPLLIWGICSSMVFGIGFKPRSWIWQVFFSPYFSLPILIGFLLVRVMG